MAKAIVKQVTGYVETTGSRRGVSGWALDPNDPAVPLTLELWVNGVPKAVCLTGLARDDVSESLGVEAAAGFDFGPDGIRAIQEAPDNAEVEVREATTGMVLPMSETARAHDLPQDDYASELDHGEFSMLVRLAANREQAERLRSQPLRPRPESSLGFIEVAAADEGGLVWVLGWMHADQYVDRPVVVLDGTKYAGGFAYTLFPRQDLPEGASGFIGVVQSDWRPSQSSKCFIFFEGEGQDYLEGLFPLNVVPKNGLVEFCRDRWAITHTGDAASLRRLMQHAVSWAPLPEDFLPEKAAVDEVLLVPGFGCFATGWVLSPTKTVREYLIRLGNNILSSEPGARSYHPRSDLAPYFPGADRMLDQAGFSAVFFGHVDVSTLSDPTLKIVYEDGTSSNHPIDPPRLRTLGQATSCGRALELFPSLPVEPFFDKFARAVREYEGARARQVTPFSVSESRKAVVFVAPQDRSGIHLMFENVRSGSFLLDKATGIVVLAAQDENRPVVVHLFDELRRRLNLPMSLFFVNKAESAVYALPAVIGQVGLERFAFVSSTVLLSDAGWRAAAAMSGGLTYFEALDPVSGEPGPSGAGFDCFSWNAADFIEWLADQDTPLGGLSAVRAMDRANSLVPHAANLTHLPFVSAFERAVNQGAE